jgi:hypothetical protein
VKGSNSPKDILLEINSIFEKMRPAGLRRG